jgi:hypothetical protein
MSGVIILLDVSTLAEIEAATEALPLQQQEELYRTLGARLHTARQEFRTARVVHQAGDTLLEAPGDAPPMTAQQVKRMLEDWP